MTTLHIEHAVTDFALWEKAFERFAAARQAAGVRGERVGRSVDDPNYILVHLDFDTTEEARAFLGFLRTDVWAVSANAPALVGTPRTLVLECPTPELDANGPMESRKSDGSTLANAGGG